MRTVKEWHNASSGAQKAVAINPGWTTKSITGDIASNKLKNLIGFKKVAKHYYHMFGTDHFVKHTCNALFVLFVIHQVVDVVIHSSSSYDRICFPFASWSLYIL